MFNLRNGRADLLDQALLGLNASDVPLVALREGELCPAGLMDNKGLYYFIPMISKGLGISIQSATDLFLGGLLLIGTLIALLSYWHLFQSQISRIATSILLLCFVYIVFRFGDIYIVNYFAVFATVPILLLRQSAFSRFQFFAFLAYCGLVAGYCNFIRFHSGTGVLIFTALWMVWARYAKWDKAIGFCVLTLFGLLPAFHIHQIEKTRDVFLSETVHSPAKERLPFPFWHLLYMGFDYFEGNVGDVLSNEAAKKIDPAVELYSAEYERILKREVIRTVSERPFFIAQLVGLKAGFLALKMVLFSFFGIAIAIFFERPGMRFVIPFFAAACFYSLNGILCRPDSEYVLGALSLAALFGCIAIGSRLDLLCKSALHADSF